MVPSRNIVRSVSWRVAMIGVATLIGGVAVDEAVAQSGSRSAPSRSSAGSARRAAPSRAPSRTVSRGSTNRSAPRVSTRRDRVNANLVSVNHNGVRSTILLQDQHGNRTEFSIDSKVDFSITRKTDSTSLAEGQLVSVQVKRNGAQILAQRLVIDIDGQGSFASKGNGSSTGSSQRQPDVLTGRILSVNPSSESTSGNGSITMRVGNYTGDVELGSGTVVLAQSRDPRLAEPGASVLVDGLRSSNGNFSVRVVSIERTSPFPTDT